MEIKISNLYDRFNFFSYSTFQKYKNDKCENKPLFGCKKDLYTYLENMYKLEFLSRKKLFKIFDEIDFLMLSLVSDEKNANDISNFSLNILNNLIEKNNLINIFDINRFTIGKNISEDKKLKLFLQISNKLNNLKMKNEWSEFDEFVLFQIINNLKRFYTICDYYNNIFDIANLSTNTLTIFPNNEDLKTKLIFNLKNKKLEIYEEENINTKLVRAKLKEPKWILKIDSKNEKYSYMDHKFNFLTIELNNKKIFYNGFQILGSETIFNQNKTNKKYQARIIKKL